MTKQQMLDQIRDEMAAGANDPVTQAVGDIATDLVSHAQEDADFEAGKTLKGAYKAMEEHAKSKRNGKTIVCLTPREALEAIAKYLGMDETGIAPKAKAQAPSQAGASLGLDLDDLLGGV